MATVRGNGGKGGGVEIGKVGQLERTGLLR